MIFPITPKKRSITRIIIPYISIFGFIRTSCGYFKNIPYKIFDPSRGGIGIRLNIARTEFIITIYLVKNSRYEEENTGKGKIRNL